MLNNFVKWFESKTIDFQAILFIIMIAIVVLIIFTLFSTKNVVSIPDTVMQTGKIENHELAGSYRIDCLDGREVMSLYNPSFTQAEFIYTGKCEETKPIRAYQLKR